MKYNIPYYHVLFHVVIKSFYSFLFASASRSNNRKTRFHRRNSLFISSHTFARFLDFLKFMLVIIIAEQISEDMYTYNRRYVTVRMISQIHRRKCSCQMRLRNENGDTNLDRSNKFLTTFMIYI